MINEWYRQGYNYYYGKEGVEKNWPKALEHFLKAAELGHATAQYYVGWMYEYGQGVDKDMDLAMQWYQKSADQGNQYAQFVLGESYYYGMRGKEVNYDMSFRWLELSAKQGNKNAEYYLGLSYDSGRGVAVNQQIAIQYFYFSAMQGHIDGALYNLMAHYQNGNVHAIDRPRCMLCFEKFSNQDWVMTGLGDIYKKGIGVAKNEKVAAEWYKKASNAGHGLGLYKMGECYEYGQGVEKDMDVAMKYYQLAANKGIKAAILKIGVVDTSNVSDEMTASQLCVRGDDYYYGRNGVEKNLEEAIKYYCKAAEKGDTIAQNDMGNCYYYGKGCQVNHAEAVRWYNRAAERGYMYAQYNLGWAYEHGEGIVQDIAKAQRWYEQAAKQGHIQAQEKIKKLS